MLKSAKNKGGEVRNARSRSDAIDKLDKVREIGWIATLSCYAFATLDMGPD